MKKLEMIEWNNIYVNLNSIINIVDDIDNEKKPIKITLADGTCINLTTEGFRSFEAKFLNIIHIGE